MNNLGLPYAIQKNLISYSLIVNGQRVLSLAKKKDVQLEADKLVVKGLLRHA